MNNQLTTSTPPPPRLPATPAKEPVLSRVLREAVARAADPHPDVGLRGISLPRAERAEAQTALARYNQLLTPADPRRIMAWLAGVNAGMAQPLSAHLLGERMPDLIDALRDLPDDVFNAGTRRDAQIAFKYFPGVAEAYALLRTQAVPLRQKRDGLLRLLKVGERPPAVAYTQDERDAIMAEWRPKFDALVADLKPTPEQAEHLGLRPRYLTREELRATYEQLTQHPDTFVKSSAHLRLRSLGVEPAPVEPVEPERDRAPMYPERDYDDVIPWPEDVA